MMILSSLIERFKKKNNRNGTLRMEKIYAGNNQPINKIRSTISRSSSEYSISNQQSILCLKKFTNHFRIVSIEKLYQDYCSQHSFYRARVVVGALLLIHSALSISFAFLESNIPNGLDLLPRSVNSIGEWVQWVYVIVAIPLIANVHYIFRRRWKRWICLILILFVLGIQMWLNYQAESYTIDYDRAIDFRLQCALLPQNETKEAIEYRKGYNIPEFLKRRNGHLYSGFISVATTLITIIGSTSAVAMRLDFLHVLLVCCFTNISMILVMDIYHVTLHYGIIALAIFPAILLTLSCYYSDRTSRRSFAAKLIVERENKKLGAALHDAEEALKNGNPCESEKQAVLSGGFQSSVLNSILIPFDEIKLEKVIGRGAMGEIILSKYLGIKVVCKRVRRNEISVKVIKQFKEEIELISCLRHPNIVQFIGASWDNASNICMVLEYLENGDLREVLHSTIGSKFTWSDPLLKIALDAGQGMLYLHSQEPPVVHRDLKSVNLLCSATYGCKISDFGLSKRKESFDALTTVVGTPFWVSPEIIRNESYGTPTDVYSFGIVLTELETRKSPYHEIDETGLKVMIRVAKHGLRPSLGSNCLPHRRKLIMDCLKDDPNERPTFAQILSQLQENIRQEIAGDAEKPVIERRELIRRQKKLIKISGQLNIDIMESNSDNSNNYIEEMKDINSDENDIR